MKITAGAEKCQATPSVTLQLAQEPTQQLSHDYGTAPNEDVAEATSA
jgi:hypothetical protein